MQAYGFKLQKIQAGTKLAIAAQRSFLTCDELIRMAPAVKKLLMRGRESRLHRKPRRVT